MTDDPRNKKSSSPIQFKAINEGLGFHPFSDGLPYAPKTKKSPPTPPPFRKPSYPTGAEAAGKPRFVKELPVQPVFKSDKKSPSTTVTTTPITEQELSYGFLFRRSLAFLIDTTLNLSLCALATYITLTNLNIDLKLLTSNETAPIVLGFFFVFNWTLITAQEVAFNTTFGKRMFGMCIEGGTPFSILTRSILFIFSVLFFGIGLIQALFDKRRKCLHDQLTRTQVVEIANL